MKQDTALSQPIPTSKKKQICSAFKLALLRGPVTSEDVGGKPHIKVVPCRRGGTIPVVGDGMEMVKSSEIFLDCGIYWNIVDRVLLDAIASLLARPQPQLMILLAGCLRIWCPYA